MKYWKCQKCGTVHYAEDDNSENPMCIQPDVFRTSGICGGSCKQVYKWDCKVCNVFDDCDYRFTGRECYLYQPQTINTDKEVREVIDEPLLVKDFNND